MARYILGRLAMLPVILLAVSLVVFLILRMAPGDPAQSWLRISQIPPTEENLVMARELLGLDRPLPVQYALWLEKASRLDFGRSYVTGRPVMDEILYYLPATLELAGASLLITMGLSVPLGVLAALRKDRLPDHLTRAMAFAGVSIPNFWFGFLLVWLFSMELGWLPPLGRGGWERLVMPAFSLALMSLAVNTRLIRASMLETMHQRYVLYARARGVGEGAVVWRHMFVNALIPILTATGMHVGELLGGAVVVESVFSWPGVGRFAVGSIFNRDFPVLQCFMLVMTTIFVVCNLAVDVAYAVADPRMRLGGAGGRP
ncbi:Nickel transport system permease protein NikB [Fundidesulfovibrio magnetotacticus]|uniref:Nickel transport system permease protein NikB n=1 Tax=Fundidesulfovibrio magnetotacticus TaxID=2730080 RepID=A0A6V8LNQ8_9BACT|nr:nickel ABC transporter permease subunit NikB [Fundidesulfovibrio magnetotacticus]GFK92640.1 Nickel transport system permease protein NikB [Fundidesulfovibrio magnetotacticus]